MTMYDTLLQLPLFQGLCKNDLTSIIEKVKFHFHHFNAGDTILKQGETNNRLIFLLDGTICSQTNYSNNYTLSEVHNSPFVIEPYSLFGMQTSYTSTYKAATDCYLLAINKEYILSELNNYEIFRINFLNMLSNRCQILSYKLNNSHIGTLKDKFIDFFLLRCTKSEGEKTLKITMEDLAKHINETRINVSKLLNELQEKQLIQLKRKEIYIPAFEKLLLELNS